MIHRSVLRKCSILGAFVLFVLCGNATTNSREGEAWLKWSPEGRRTYVQGYLQGLQEGFASGCRFGVEGGKPEISYDEETKSSKECWSHYPVNYKDPAPFIDKITLFYQEYPTEQSTPIAQILKELYRGGSLSEFHKNHLTAVPKKD